MPAEGRVTELALVILDCDGVILESVDAKTRAFAQLYRPHGPDIERLAVEHHLRHGGVSRYEKFRYISRQYLGRELPADEEVRLGERFAGLCLEEVLASPLVPGALAFIQAARQRVPVYVASGAPHEELAHILQTRGLAGLFTGIFGSPPGKAELVRRILAQEGVLPRAAVLIGDSGTDEAAAVETGVRFWGRGEFPGRECSPDLTGAMVLLDRMCGVAQ
jgi:beta-phosphoglucomutase-like phosphatase (HAD superfamily)